MATATTLGGLDELQAEIRGDVIAPDDARYEDARKVYNAMIDKHPALIVRCNDQADVITAVKFAAKENLDVAVRGGGHNGAGLGTVDDGLVIDLTPMRWTRVDRDAKTVVAGGGCQLGDIDHAAHSFGLATPLGIISTTGIGLTLGGGVGHLSRKYGLTIDNIIGADIVLADGSVVRASEDENDDLFWAIRGGGGNFGIVTSFEYRLHPIKDIYGGPKFFELSDAGNDLPLFRAVVARSPPHPGVLPALQMPPPPPSNPA